MTSHEFFEWVYDAQCDESRQLRDEAISKHKSNGFVESDKQKADRAYRIYKYIKSRQPQGTHKKE